MNTMHTIKSIRFDNAGYVTLLFENFNERAAFIRNCVPAGNCFAVMRPSSEGDALTWKLSDLNNPEVLTDGMGIGK